ncbi:unnamed protein product, partial [Prorocentrum cordatum]
MTRTQIRKTCWAAFGDGYASRRTSRSPKIPFLPADFNMKVRFQGHVDSTPPDHLRCILRVVVQEACAGCDLAAPKLQPGAVAKRVQPCVERWAPLLEVLFGKIDDVLEGADTVIHGIEEGIEACQAEADVPAAGLACGVVGSLMAVREIDMIEDE